MYCLAFIDRRQGSLELIRLLLSGYLHFISMHYMCVSIHERIQWADKLYFSARFSVCCIPFRAACHSETLPPPPAKAPCLSSPLTASLLSRNTASLPHAHAHTHTHTHTQLHTHTQTHTRVHSHTPTQKILPVPKAFSLPQSSSCIFVWDHICTDAGTDWFRKAHSSICTKAVWQHRRQQEEPRSAGKRSPTPA